MLRQHNNTRGKFLCKLGVARKEPCRQSRPTCLAEWALYCSAAALCARHGTQWFIGNGSASPYAACGDRATKSQPSTALIYMRKPA